MISSIFTRKIDAYNLTLQIGFKCEVNVELTGELPYRMPLFTSSHTLSVKLSRSILVQLANTLARVALV